MLPSQLSPLLHLNHPFTWSSAGTLTDYSGPDLSGASTGSINESYTYNGDGLRQTKTTSNQRTHEAWDISGPLPLMITDGPTSYITGPGNLPIEQITAAGTVRYFSHDQLGSTTALTDQLGATVQTYTYDGYGQLTSATPTIDNPFQYAGQYTDQKTGLRYLRARYLDPSTGQFLSRDPIEDTTLQPYAYANNSPTNGTDPTGLSFLSSAGGFIGSFVPTPISDAAAWAIDGITFGAASDITCNGLTAGKIDVAGRKRIPDGLTSTTLSEAKNVSSLSYSGQLRDFADYAGQTGRSLDLYVRPTTRLSGPLQRAAGPGGPINLRFIP